MYNTAMNLSQINLRIRRLEVVLEGLKAVNNRYSVLRLLIFLGGGAAAWFAASRWGAGVGIGTALAATIIFITVVIFHHRLDDWRETFRLQKGIYEEQAARLVLDWEHIPHRNPTGIAASPLAVDLDLTGPRSLHHLIDTTISSQGSRLLADLLTIGMAEPETINKRQSVVKELADSARFCNRLTILFRRLTKDPLEGERLLKWLETPLPGKTLNRLLPWVSLLTAANAILFGLNAAGVLPPYWILTLILYAVLYFSTINLIGEFLEAVIDLDGELRIFQPLLTFLERYPYGQRVNLQEQCRVFLEKGSRPSQQLGKVKLITTLAGIRMNQIIGLVLNTVLPWDYWVAWLAHRRQKHMASVLPVWLKSFHELESLKAMGEFASLHREYSFPEVRVDSGEGLAVFEAEEMGHPLIAPDRKVRNDLRIDKIGELLIITGSNMSGKSTFLRTVGINLCLANAGCPVEARTFCMLPFRLYTSIRINDSLEDGFSFFYSEVKRLRGLLEALRAATPNQPLLYLVDEIFRGTNNRERLIGSQAFVRSLAGENGVGLLATHDLELAGLADQLPGARNHHFSDQVVEGRLLFDYRLKAGPSTTTNALKIMEMEGLPVDAR